MTVRFPVALGLAFLLSGGWAARAAEPVRTGAPLVVEVRVEGTIDGGLAAFIERALETAEAESAAAFLITMNTYGGRVDAADQIRAALLNTHLRTITYVHDNAASAGALIAMATDSIDMAPGSAIGAATPVDQTGAVASAKVISYFRSIMGATARAKGRDPQIAEAMVDSSVVVKGLEDAPRPLTLRGDQAIRIGVAQAEAHSIDDVLRLNGLAGARIELITPNWSEHFVRFLTDPIVSGLLMTAGALGLIYELTHPGLALPGIIGIVCLALFFGSHWIVKLAQLSELLMFLGGVVLVVVELFVPGGILGLIGVGLIIAALFLSMVGRIEFARPADISHALAAVGMAIVLTFSGGVVLLKSISKLPMFRRLRLEARHQPGPGLDTATQASRAAMVGAEGVAETVLRPSGRAVIGGRSVEVVTDGERIEAGTHVVVVVVDGLRGVVVREA